MLKIKINGKAVPIQEGRREYEKMPDGPDKEKYKLLYGKPIKAEVPKIIPMEILNPWK